MMFKAQILAGVALLPMSCPAWAWGPEGHDIVAAIAAANMTPKARAQVSALLGGDTMIVLDANWADEIRNDRPETSKWHFVNIPLDAAAYDPRRDCADAQCVVAQIERDAQVVGDRSVTKEARAEALRFLIHFVGDLHQPLHAVDNHDKGGNDDIVFFDGRRTNLHRVWDGDVVLALGNNVIQVAQQIDTALTPQQKRADSSGVPEDWANESLTAGKTIYAGMKSDYLPNNYARQQSPLVRDRLAKAGLRLAAMLNRIFK